MTLNTNWGRVARQCEEWFYDVSGFLYLTLSDWLKYSEGFPFANCVNKGFRFIESLCLVVVPTELEPGAT